VTVGNHGHSLESYSIGFGEVFFSQIHLGKDKYCSFTLGIHLGNQILKIIIYF